MTGSGPGSPCGACKFLRRKCVKGCVFAPYFCHEQGAAHFAAIHKVVNLQAQLASLKEQAAQATSANPNDKYYGKLPSQAQQPHGDVQSWFHPHDSTMAVAPPRFNPNHSSPNSYPENGFSDPTSLGNYEISSSSGEDRSSFTAFGGEAPASLEQWSFQDMDDLQSMAFGYALHS
ncbi:hypothetical protein V6N12_014164 [Hibiscus sabdariffa]|uniref:LOB domain-containing protein n=1 Tax=Hibiscus sabdariffa TaxID=183260 RepID=A0ABR2DJC4_9ROSI